MSFSNADIHESKTCFVCKKGKLLDCKNNNHIDRRKSLKGSWNFLKCNSCGIESIHPIPNPDELSYYYSIYDQKKPIEIKQGLGSRYEFLRKAYHFLNGDVDPRDFIKKDPRKNMLDYGFGGATFLKYFHDKGCNIIGAEVSDEAVNSAEKAGLKVKKVQNFESIPFDDKKFDVVYLMQVFEHLIDPRIFLFELNRILKINGELYLGLPNYRSFWKNVFKKNWVCWFPPFHIVHYTTESIEKISSDFGFEVIDSWSKTPESWFRFSLKAKIFKDNNDIENTITFIDRQPIKLIIMLILRMASFFIKEHDCMVVKLKKINHA